MTKFESIFKEVGSIHHNKCIDGSVTGSGCCVGYCTFEEHPGFLTKELRKKHNCINKGCHYYVAKTKTAGTTESVFVDDALTYRVINSEMAKYEGVKIISISRSEFREYTIKYIAITNAYSFENIAKELVEETGCNIVFQKLNYSFENCVQLILQN